MRGPWRAIGLSLWLGLLPVLGALYLTVPVAPDHALFDYIAWSHLQGSALYADVAEQNWPGAMLFHELGIRLFGVHFWTFRLIDYLVLQVLTFAGAGFLHRAGFRVAPWIFLIVYPALYVTTGMWTAGQRDIVAAGLLLAAAALVLPALRPVNPPEAPGWKQGGAQHLLAGGLIAVAVLMRPTYLSYLLGLIVLEGVRFPGERERHSTPLRRAFFLMIGFAVPVSALVLAGAWTGSLDDFYEQTILFNLQAYQDEGSRLHLVARGAAMILESWHWIAALATIGLLSWFGAAGLSRALVMVLGLMATVLVSFLLQNKGFGYHLSGLLPVLCLLLAIMVDRVALWWSSASTGPSRWGLGIALASSLALITVGTANKLASLRPQAQALSEGRFEPYYNGEGRPSWAEVTEMVRLIREGTDPGQHVLQWGRLFEVGYLAERPSSFRFVSTPALGLLSDGFSGTDAWLAEVRNDLKSRPPAFVAIDRTALASVHAPYHARPNAPEAERIVVESLADYEPVFETSSTILFQVK